jgi:hypothetical protein
LYHSAKVKRTRKGLVPIYLPSAIGMYYHAAVALAAACVLAVGIRQRAWDSVSLMALPPTELRPNTVGHYRCDAKCEKAWTKHVKEVQARLAAEHKKPSAAPTVPLPAVHAKTPAVEHHAWLHGARPAHAVRSGAVQSRPAHADKLKVAEAILNKGSTRKRVSLEHLYTQHSLMENDVKWGAAHPVGTQNKLPGLAHSPHPIFARRPTQMFWRRLLHTKRHEPWKQGRQLRKKELDAASRRGARVDHTLDYLHVPASREDPVKSELSKLGLVQDKHSFSSLQTPVDHTLDYLRVPADERKVDIEAVDTIRAYSKFEPSRGEMQRQLHKMEREEE